LLTAEALAMARNIVICCDGTGNQVEANLSNVLKLFRTLERSAEQLVFYDPGVGTLGSLNAWARYRQKAKEVFGLATGYGLDDNILDAYRFLVDHHRPDDRIYLFGFSRGAYTVRVLAGFLQLVGLVQPAQRNLARYALTAYKQAAGRSDFTIAWRFEEVLSTRRVPIRFIGVWDTVSSVIVPRPDRLYVAPSLQTLPYTATNPMVEAFRQAIAIDERRRMFRLNRWQQPQTYKPNPFDEASARPQDIRQVWFAGVHADVGGGYPEDESGLAKFPLMWMLDEAKAQGLRVRTEMYKRLVLGAPRKGSSRSYAKPDATARAHDSMTGFWPLLEWLPKPVKWREWPARRSRLGFYLPRSEPRPIPDDALIHGSVKERLEKRKDYRPPNLPNSPTYV